MKLFREEYQRYNKFNSYVKEYNESGLIVFESEVEYLFNSESKYYYNEKKQITKIEMRTASSEVDTGINEVKHLLVYEYSGENYRIITYTTHFRYNNNSEENEWINMNEIVSIKEFRFENKLLVSEKYNDLTQNKSYHYKYSYNAGSLEIEERKEENGTFYRRKYQKGLIMSEERHDIDGTVYKDVYSYTNSLLFLKETFKDEISLIKIKYDYVEGQLQSENIYKTHNTIEYLANSKKYFYNSKSEIEKIETYGRYNSKMYVYKVEETYRDENVLTEKRRELAYFDYYTDNYDFNSMLEELDDDLKQGLTEDMYENRNFDNNFQSIKEFDSKNNLIQYKCVNPDNPDEVYEKSIYHFEYGSNSQLEFIICFDIDSRGHVEENYIKKFYYK